MRLNLRVLLFLAVLGRPAAAETLTEDVAVDKALQHSHLLRAQADSLRLARQSGDLGDAWPQPMARLTVSQIGLPMRDRPSAWLMVDQPIALGHRRAAQAELGRAVAEGAASDGQTLAGDVAYATRMAFARWRGLLRADALLARHVAMAEAVGKSLVAALSAGKDVPASRLAQSEADIAALRAQQEAVQAALPDAALALRQFTGADFSHAASELPAAPTPIDVARHPAVAKLAARARQAVAQAQVARTSDEWTVVPSAGLMTMPDMPVGLMLSVGLRPGAVTSAEQQRLQARADLSLAAARLQQAYADAFQQRLAARCAAADSELRQTWVRLRALQEKVLPAQRRAVDAALPGIASGSRSVSDVLEARHRLANVELQIADLETQWLVQRAARIRLQTADDDMPAMPLPAAESAMPAMDDGDAGMPASKPMNMQ